jgi:hypothetical protein
VNSMTLEDLFPGSPRPDFQLLVRNGELSHRNEHASRHYQAGDIEISKATDSDSTALLFNGASSHLQYDIKEWPELSLEGAYTCHVRLKFSNPGSEKFILGRTGFNFLSLPETFPQGNFSPGGGHLIASNSRARCRANVSYDIVLRFDLGTSTVRCNTIIEVYEASTGMLIGFNHPLPRAFDEIVFGRDDTHFRIGQCGDYANFDGEIQQLTLWNQFIAPKAKLAPAHHPSPDTESIQTQPELYDQNASERWQQWLASRRSFPLAAWGYFHRYEANLEEYQTYREAGLTMVMAPLGSALVAELADLDPIIGLWQDDGSYAELYQNPDRLAHYVDFSKSTLKRCAGYMLADEPRFNGPSIEELAPGFLYIYTHDKQALPMVNMMTYAYNMGRGFAGYIDDIIRANHPPFLVSDPYVLFEEGLSNDDQFYANIEIVRGRSLSAGIGFMGFVLVTGHRRRFPEYSFRTASESDLCWQANTLLAYGAQGLWYYNYRISGEGYDEAMVTDVDGKPTESYHRIQKLNFGILAISSLLMKLKSVGVFHCPNDLEFLPGFTRPYFDGAIRDITQLQATDILISEFRDVNAETSCVYVMLVNKRHAADTTRDASELQASIALRVTEDFMIERINNATGAAETLTPDDRELSLTLGGGDRALLRLTPQD